MINLRVLRPLVLRFCRLDDPEISEASNSDHNQ